MSCRVFIADDVEAMRYLWRTMLEEDPALEIVGEAADGRAALDGVEATRPDVLLLDLSMPELDGLEVIPVIRTASPETGIVVASAFSTARMAAVALELGASSYFEKGHSAEALRALVTDACSTRT